MTRKIMDEATGKRPWEVECYTVAVGNLPGIISSRKSRKAAKEAMTFIAGCDGFIGIHPVPPHGTLCLFETENAAKIARNRMREKGIHTGHNICKVFIEKKWYEMAMKKRAGG